MLYNLYKCIMKCDMHLLKEKTILNVNKLFAIFSDVFVLYDIGFMKTFIRNIR